MTFYVIALAAAALWLIQRYGEQGDAIVNTSPSQKIIDIAAAFFQAENSGHMNARNNPGNIRDSSGAIATYATDADGWQHLYNKIDYDFVSARSVIYSPAMTWREVAWMWVAGGKPEMVTPLPGDLPDNWAAIVAGRLRVPVNSTVAEYLAS